MVEEAVKQPLLQLPMPPLPNGISSAPPGSHTFPSFIPPHPSASSSGRLRTRYNRAMNLFRTCHNLSHSLRDVHYSYSAPSQAAISPQFSSSFSAAVSDRIRSYLVDRARDYNATRPPSSSIVDGVSVGSSSYTHYPLYEPDFAVAGSSAGTWSSSSFGYSATSAPVPIVADAVSLPSHAGTASLCDNLPDDLRARYLDPRSLLRRPCEAIPSAAAVPIRDQLEYEKLVRRMHVAGMVDFVLNPIVVNGVFCVPKDDNALRLIIDARRTNAIFVTPPHVDLPTPDLLARLTVGTGQPFYVAGDDADNFYHRLRLPREWMPYFALPPVRTTAIGIDGEWGDRLVYPCCLTLPMGFSHSVFIAQQVHEHIIYSRTSLLRHDRISRMTDLRIDRLRHSIYIDDLGLFGFDPGVIRRVQDEYKQAMASVGLPIKPSKHVDPSCDGVRVLGMIIHGRNGTVGLAGADLHALVLRTHQLIAQHTVSGDELARIVGRWTWAALPARPALSVFSSVYRYIELIGRRRGTLWRTVVRELRTICGLAPLLSATITAPGLPEVAATDASMVAQGVAVQRVTPAVAAAASTHAGLFLNHQL